jgi:hypothetical protein
VTEFVTALLHDFAWFTGFWQKNNSLLEQLDLVESYFFCEVTIAIWVGNKHLKKGLLSLCATK